MLWPPKRCQLFVGCTVVFGYGQKLLEPGRGKIGIAHCRDAGTSLIGLAGGKFFDPAGETLEFFRIRRDRYAWQLRTVFYGVRVRGYVILIGLIKCPLGRNRAGRNFLRTSRAKQKSQNDHYAPSIHEAHPVGRKSKRQAILR